MLKTRKVNLIYKLCHLDLCMEGDNDLACSLLYICLATLINLTNKDMC